MDTHVRDYIRGLLKGQDYKDKDLLPVLKQAGQPLDKSTLSRRLNGVSDFRRAELAAIDAHFALHGELLLRAGVPVDLLPYAGYGESPVLLPVGARVSLKAVHWELVKHLRDGSSDNPQYMAEIAKQWALQLEAEMKRERTGTTRSKDLFALTGFAWLVHSWGLMNSLPRTELDEAINKAQATRERYPTPETSVLATTIVATTSRMKTGKIGDVDALERLKAGALKRLQAEAPPSLPLIGGYYHEELSRQHLLSPEHTLSDVQNDIDDARHCFGSDPGLRGKLQGIADLGARAIGLKPGEGHPQKGAERMRDVVAGLRRSEYPNTDLLVRASAYQGMMQLEAGDASGEATLQQAYKDAESIGIGYFLDWIPHQAALYQVRVPQPAS